MKCFNVASMMLITLFVIMNFRATVGTSDKCFHGLKKNRVPLIDNALNSTSNITLRGQSHALQEESSSCPFGTHMITYSTTTLTSHSLIILIINIPVHYVRFIVRTTPILYNKQQQQQKGDKKDRGIMFVPFPSFNDNDDDYDEEEKSPDNCYCDDEVDDDDDDDEDDDDDDADYLR